jgi:hypothetical protein
MSQHVISYYGAEIASIEICTAKSGNNYAKGTLILRDESGKFEASHRFRSYNAVDVLTVLELQYFAKQSPTAETSGSDLQFDEAASENTETRERTVAKATARPRVNVSGWFKTSKFGDNWNTALMLESVSI